MKHIKINFNTNMCPVLSDCGASLLVGAEMFAVVWHRG